MKKLISYKRKAMVCLALLCLFLVQGCKKDGLQKETGIASAEAWYARQDVQSKKYLVSSRGDTLALTISPKWSEAQALELGGQTEAYVVPLETDLPTALVQAISPILVMRKKGSGYEAKITSSAEKDPVANQDISKMYNTKSLYEKAFGNGQKMSQGNSHAIANKPGINSPALDTINHSNPIWNKIMGPVNPMDDCTDWFLVTRDGDGEVISEEYVGTTCNTGPTEGGGGGGGGGPSDGGNANDFGMDPNCLNCKILDLKFESFLAYLKELGIVATEPFHTTVTLGNDQYPGMMVELYNADGSLIGSFFTPDTDSGLFTMGIHYSVGFKGADGNSSPKFQYGIVTLQFPTIYYNRGRYRGSGGITYTPKNTYTEAEMLDMINSMEDPITGNGIELYLILKYKGSKLFDLSNFSSTANSIEVGAYTLTPHYDRTGKLVFYAGSRLSATILRNGIEYIIRPDQLNNFRTNIDYYTSAASLVYMNGIPERGMVQMMAGDRVGGLLTMWGDAIKSPTYWIYLATLYVTNPTNATVRSNAIRSIESATSKEIVVLGHYPEYAALADELIAKKFEIPLNIWEGMSEAERWVANQRFLDRAIAKGNNIILATPVNKVKPGSYFEKELSYLFGKGYRVGPDGKWLIK